MGFSTAGKPTSLPAASTSASDLMMALRGVGSPAFFMTERVLCLSRASSTAAGWWPGRPMASARRETRGTASSTNVTIPSAEPVFPSWPSVLMCARASLKTCSPPSEKSTGKNFAMTPSSTRVLAQESWCSMTTTFIPSDAARSKVNLFPCRPAQMNTQVAPRAICLRRACPLASEAVRRNGSTFESIWNVAVGSSERIAPSRWSADIGFGRAPGEHRSISASYRPRINFGSEWSTSLEEAMRIKGMSMSIPMLPWGLSMVSISISNSTG
mmetsp:Transcript_73899/g.193838  ORF Transcript_73899/g.193838 Transcript_73899/m.193838 type:complete len:270 (+) Transcript_73899:1169-1978(+)